MKQCAYLLRIPNNLLNHEAQRIISSITPNFHVFRRNLSSKSSTTISDDKTSRCPFLKATEILQPKIDEEIVAKVDIGAFVGQTTKDVIIPKSCPFHKILAENGQSGAEKVDHIPKSQNKTADKKPSSFDYTTFFQEEIDKKKRDNSYRIFKKILRKADNFPYAMEKSKKDGDVVVWCSNDYLGMSWHPKVMEAAIQAIRQHGTGSGGTRNISGNTILHEQLENKLARLHGKEAALVFTSCYVANEASLHTLGTRLPGVHIFSDVGNHASMIHGIRTSRAHKSIFRHNDAAHLDELLTKNKLPGHPSLVAFETVHSMTGDICPLDRLLSVCEKHSALSFVDEVHAVGLYGKHGAGVAERDNVMNRIDLITGTLGKAFGNVGGYIAGDRGMVDMIRSYASGFIFTTSLPPSVLAAAEAAVNILASDEGIQLRAQHQNVVRTVKEALLGEGIPVIDCPSHIIPVHVGDPGLSTHLCNELLAKHNIYVQAINYPTVAKGEERLRIAPTPHHSPRLISELVQAMSSLWRENGLPLVGQASSANRSAPATPLAA